MEPTLEQIERLLELEKKATPGPWHVYDRGIGFELHAGPPLKDGCDCCQEINGGWRETFTQNDADILAAARNILPSLAQSWLDQSRALKELTENVQATLAYLPDGFYIKVCEGLGPENLSASLAVSAAKLGAEWIEMRERIEELAKINTRFDADNLTLIKAALNHKHELSTERKRVITELKKAMLDVEAMGGVPAGTCSRFAAAIRRLADKEPQ